MAAEMGGMRQGWCQLSPHPQLFKVCRLHVIIFMLSDSFWRLKRWNNVPVRCLFSTQLTWVHPQYIVPGASQEWSLNTDPRVSPEYCRIWPQTNKNQSHFNIVSLITFLSDMFELPSWSRFKQGHSNASFTPHPTPVHTFNFQTLGPLKLCVWPTWFVTCKAYVFFRTKKFIVMCFRVWSGNHHRGDILHCYHKCSNTTERILMLGWKMWTMVSLFLFFQSNLLGVIVSWCPLIMGLFHSLLIY